MSKKILAPISQTEIETRISGHLDELLELWWAEQGVSKPRDLQLIASALPFARDRAVRVLDLCCGPGDVGRAIRHDTQMPKSTAWIETRSSCRSALA